MATVTVDKPPASRHSFEVFTSTDDADRLGTVTKETSPALARLAGDEKLLGVLNGSALDINDMASASSLELPVAAATDPRVRRRSDFSRGGGGVFGGLATISTVAPAVKSEVLELHTISGAASNAASTTASTIGEPLRDDKSTIQVRVSDAVTGLRDQDVEGAASSASRAVADDVNFSMESISAAQQAIYKKKSDIHFFALCWCVFGMGWNDGTTGPMLPRIQEHYHVNFAMVSMIFVLGALGFVSGSIANVYLTDLLGFGKILILGALLQLAAYVMISPAGPFPVMCCAFFLIGLGLSVQNAHANGFVASLKKHARTKMGLLHGSYGLGALVSPLVSTQFSKSTRYWSYHYIISAALYVSIAVMSWFVFRGKTQDEVLKEEGELHASSDAPGPSNKYKQIFGLKEVHLIAMFAIIYVGVEVTMGGWSVTYILEKRNGGSNSGYIATGFFAGLMLGRILLMWLNKRIGERFALFLYAVLAIALEITVWVVPSLIENAIAVSFVGLVLGPMYPILMNHSSTILPRWLLTGCMGYIAGVGQAGSAILPFITGILASRFGIASLQPFIVSMMSALIVLWAMIPRARYVPT
ncbi:major facilitator superfamily domain-containing protein [Fomes fomentarius]|nr:major facilitator superfamily domain-containing protein [Fomes fomentarius]